MGTTPERPEVAVLRRQSSLHTARMADARRDVAAAYRDQVELIAALEGLLTRSGIPSSAIGSVVGWRWRDWSSSAGLRWWWRAPWFRPLG